MELEEIVKQVTKRSNNSILPLTTLNRSPNGLDSPIPPTLIVTSDGSADIKRNPHSDSGSVFDDEKLTTILCVENEPQIGILPRTGSSASRNWRKIKNTVQANNAFQQAEREKNKKVHRQMQGSKAAIPVLPLPLAILFLLMNCLVPGLGTIVSSFTYCCVATTYDIQNREGLAVKVPGLIATNVCIGLAQLLTVTFLLVGWFWSISWGITMVYLAMDRRIR